MAEKKYTVEDLKDMISLYLDTILEKDCPMVFANVQEPEDKAKMVENICSIVLSQKIDIGQAIVEWETTYNINMLD